MPSFVHNGTMIEWTFKRHHFARGLKVKVYADGRVIVTSSPRYASEAAAERLVRSRAAWIIRALSKMKDMPHVKPLQGSKEAYRRFKKAALSVVRERIERYAPLYGVVPSSVSIRNQKNRWGSCSRSGSLSFHYKIALVPRPLADYLVVHELCHLRFFDHSPQFWEAVGQAIKDFKRMRKLLRTYGFEKEN